MIHRHSYKGGTWIDIERPTIEEIIAIRDEFRVDTRIAHELEIPRHKSHIELFDSTLLLSLTLPVIKQNHSKKNSQKNNQKSIQNSQLVSLVLGEKFLITMHAEPSEAIHRFAKSLEVESIIDKDDVLDPEAFMFFRVMNELYESQQHQLAYIDDVVDDIEEKIFAGKEREMVIALSRVSKNLLDFKKTLNEHEEVLVTLEGLGKKFFDENFAYHSHGFLTRYYKIERMVQNLRESVSELRDTNDSLVETKQNEIGKVITVLAFIAAPLSLIIGIFQIDTKARPIIGGANDFWILVGSVFVIGGAMFLFFKYKKWL